MWLSLRGCTSYLDARSSVVFWVDISSIFQFFSKALIRPTSWLCSVLFHLLSQALTRFNSRHIYCSVLSRLLSSPGPIFRDLLRHFSSCWFFPSVVVFHVLLQINSIFNERSTSPIVCWHNKYKWVFFWQTRREKMAFLRSPVRLTSRRPSSSPRVCTDGVRLVASSLVRWRHNQIFLAWWVTNFP